MSWSRSLSGTRAACLALLAVACEEVRSLDESYSAAPAVVDAHQAQLVGIHAMVEALPENAQISGSVYGDGSADGSGSLGCSISYTLVPAADALGANASHQIVSTNAVEQDDVLPGTSEGSEA